MASRRSHAAYHCRSSISAVSRGDTYLSETHCKLRRSAAVGQTIILNIIGDASVPLRGTHLGRYHIYPQLRCFAACSGFHDIGPAPRNPQLILNLLAFVGCVATAGRHSLLGLLRQLVALIQQFAIRFRCSFSATL